jgi:hypothetical protein
VTKSTGAGRSAQHGEGDRFGVEEGGAALAPLPGGGGGGALEPGRGALVEEERRVEPGDEEGRVGDPPEEGGERIGAGRGPGGGRDQHEDEQGEGGEDAHRRDLRSGRGDGLRAREVAGRGAAGQVLEEAVLPRRTEAARAAGRERAAGG